MGLSPQLFYHDFVINISSPESLTVQPLGVVLRRTQWRQAAQAAVDGRVPSRKVHGSGGVQLPAGGDERGGVVQRVVGAAGHSANLVVDLRQVCQLGWRRDGGESELMLQVFNGGGINRR